MALSARKKLILAALESTAGTAVATAASDAILVHDPELTPLTGGTVDRDLVRSYYGASDQIPVNSHQQLAFGVEIAGPGTYTIANEAIGTPGWGRLLQACGFSETAGKINATDANNSKVTYDLLSGNEKSLTVRANWAGQQHVLTSCRGNMAINIASAEIPRFRFTLTGLWNDPDSVAAISPSYTAFKAPAPGSNVATPTAQLFGSDMDLRSIEIDMGVEVVHREIIGSASQVLIVDRSVSGTIVMDAQALSTLNVFEKARDGDTGALKMVHGGADTSANAGKLVEISCPKIQLGEPSYSEDQNILQWSVPFVALPDSGNDELTVIAR